FETVPCGLNDTSVLSSEYKLAPLLSTHSLRLVCPRCSVQQREITYTLTSVQHQCERSVLLCKARDGHTWRPVSRRPKFPNPSRYEVCYYFKEGSGCREHKNRCTFARSDEEAAVWMFEKDEFMRLIIKSEAASTPEHAAQSILQQCPGEFMELCRDCFQDKKLTGKRWNATCSADAAHIWEPVLVHHLSGNGGKQVYSQVRPIPPNCPFDFCSHVQQGKPCWHTAGQCRSAQSEVEMLVWRAEHGGLPVRPHLLQLSQKDQSKHKQGTMYCKVCLLNLSSPESFYKHCSSLEHAQLLCEDTTTRWRGRRPPHGQRADFRLCERPLTCEYGSKCPKAHSVEELQEWMMRAAEEKEIRDNMDAQGLMCYNEKLLEEYRNSSNEVHIISEQVDEVSISCDEDLSVQQATNHHFSLQRQLLHVALLKQEPGASFSLGNMSSSPCIYLSGKHFLVEDTTYDITVSFTSTNPGLYEQWLVLDFGMRPVLLKKFRVRVGQQLVLDETEDPAVNPRATFQTAERWHRGNRVIIPGSSRTEEQEELLKEYKPPQINFLYKSSRTNQTPLNHENYRERMHHFLYDEERAEDQVVSRLNVRGEITTLDTLTSTQFGTMIAPLGQLYCAVSISCNLTPDTPEGQVLKRSIKSGLIAPISSNGTNSKVYEATILQDKTSENKMYLQLSKKCCSDLSLEGNQTYQMEVQFQLDRFSFCTMHKAVDLLPDTKRVLPDLKDCTVPQSDILHKKLNPKQQSAISFITGNSIVPRNVAPLLIYGPFGTGKTFTLATAARELCKQPHSKVLICTYTNSSADLYVRDHLHPFIDGRNDGLRPLRIKANKHGKALFATDAITLKYCLLSEDGQCFLPPTKAALDRHKIVITTTSMARRFVDLKLPEGYFTHILIDEASQMLECEALLALGLAGPDTRVVLAGDHMQMGPKLFSVDDHHRSNQTLLNRLFHYYQGQKCDAAHNSRIIFSENYRSTSEIVEFVSTFFYVGKNDVIKAAGNIPAPANGHALKFYHVRGECLLDTVSLSWYNKEEVTKVVEAVEEILKQWPSTWEAKDLSSICVLSEGIQVRKIRKALSKRRIHGVCVENLTNFRAVVITAVQTRDSLKTSHLAGLELFNDARVLNTAMTRAQSQVVVVGDSAALCCFGKCSAVWKSYIDHCISNNSVEPKHFTKDFFEKDVMETARFKKTEHAEESEGLNDTILQELKDEYIKLESEYSSNEDTVQGKDINHQKFRSSYSKIYGGKDLLESCNNQPEEYTQGKVFRESSNRGYVIPFHNPARHFLIKGRANMGNVFTGDEVVLQSTKVVSITKEAESARVLVKFVKRLMIPIKRSEPKIRILINKKSRNFLPIWERTMLRTPVASERINEKLRQNHVFMVKVIGWREPYRFPLGKVIEIIPVGTSLIDGLRILNEEFKVEPNVLTSDDDLSKEDEDRTRRENLCDVITFTVDPEEAEDLDDAISVREMEDQYELGIHIADVASYVQLGSKLDVFAKKRGTSYYCNDAKPNHMFPENLSTGHLSLLEGKDRRVVSLMIRANKQTNEIIGQPKFQLSQINSNKRLSYSEAEEVITKRRGTGLEFKTVEDCVSMAYCFAKAQRKKRLVDWAYSQPDEQRVPGKRKAHLMIEELSVLYNTHASMILIGSDKTKCCTPLRCQKEPNPEKIKEFKEKCGGLIPLSSAVRHKVEHNGKAPNCENFPILTEVWNNIQSAAEADDVDTMVDLIAADDIHPLLQPVIDEFRKCSSKALVAPFGSSESQVGHYSLSVPFYTQASSPIRRYMDIVLQRLLHSVISNSVVQYTKEEITSLCNEFELSLTKAKEHDQKAEQLFYAVNMKNQSATKVAFVVSVDSSKESFTVSFPFNKNISRENLSIMYRDLQLWDQPKTVDARVRLAWKRRLYAVGDMQIQEELKRPDCGPCVELPLTLWKDTVEALDKEDWKLTKDLIMKGCTKKLQENNTLPQSSEIPDSESDTDSSEDKEAQSGHEVEIKLDLRAGDTLQIQMTWELKRGYYMPAVQLVRIKPKFEICVEHVHSPITCLSRSADNPSNIRYRNIEEYVRIWKPLCEMESAANAVNEEDSIVIENLVLTFKQQQRGTLSGSFFLSQAWIDKWAIECHLSQCFLCIRKRGLKLTSTPEHSALVDPKEFTWVAHGVTRKVDLKKTPNKGSNVEFDINYLPMETIPDCVFQKNTTFTVEIIPKSLPDVRKEHAVVSMTSASDLVQAIALGFYPREGRSLFHTSRLFVDLTCRVHKDEPYRRTELDNGLPKLNLSQRLAVNKALNNTFTVIQGPPGTGKTVVGVYLVYCFFELNSQNPRKSVDPNDKNKKEIILYCGPSNKSVDVVAEYLVRFGGKIKPLRVYGQQVEMLDYPYPDGTVNTHTHSVKDQNPKSGKIKEFDQRIEVARRTKNKSDQLSDEEVKE
uniref:RNB domain-containing protein n=1 Tax=Labrus bergylta TaxID=56723 RepID=A0A3Q3LAP8_9LABR